MMRPTTRHKIAWVAASVSGAGGYALIAISAVVQGGDPSHIVFPAYVALFLGLGARGWAAWQTHSLISGWPR